MADIFTPYEAAIEAVRNAHEAYNLAVQTLADAEEELENQTAIAFQLDPDAAAFVAAGNNETARKERRTIWLGTNRNVEQEAVRTAKAEKATAEMHFDHAKRLCTIARMRCEWLMAGNLPDLLGPEPPVGRLPADPRRVADNRWEEPR